MTTYLLAADLGMAVTRLTLFSLDGGVQHIHAEAATTINAPREGVQGGLFSAARELEVHSGHRILTGESLAVGGGVPPSGLVLCTSIGNPLEVAALVATPEFSGCYVQQAIRGTYARLSETHQGLAALVEQGRVDAIVVAGGCEGVDEPPILQSLPRLPATRPIPVIYAGPRTGVSALERRLAGRADLRVIGNIMPTLERGQPALLTDALDELYVQHKAGLQRGFQAVASACACPPISTARALGLTWSILADIRHEPILGLDIGAATTIAGLALPGRPCHIWVEPSLGIGGHAATVVAEAGRDKVAGWLADPAILTVRAIARRGRTFTQDHEEADLTLAWALGRTAGSLTLQRFRQGTRADLDAAGTVVVSGGLVQAGTPDDALLLTLDTVQPTGIVNVLADRGGWLTQAGAIAALSPEMAQTIITAFAEHPLATVVALGGQLRVGEALARAELTSPDGRHQAIVEGGQLCRLPLAPGQKGELTIWPLMRHATIAGVGSRLVHQHVVGSELGVVVDGRGRPVPARYP